MTSAITAQTLPPSSRWLRLFLQPLFLLLASLVLAACGGGGGGGGGSTPLPSGAPSIITQPANVAVTAGQAASFSVNVTGTAPLAYQWSRNGVAIAGASASSYSIASTALADNGAQFRVTVSNADGNVTSTPATLTVSAAVVAPSFTSQPANATVTAGQTATFSAAATGSGTLVYQWLRNGTPITGATGTSYTTPALTVADSGVVYSVTVRNDSPTTATSAGALLTVNPLPVAPSITTQPASQAVTAGQSAVFNVVATGDPVLTYQWRRNGADIAGATGATYSTPSTVLADNGANFSVEVRNGAGMVTSATATLTVNPAPVAPTVTAQPQPVSVLVGASATFSVTATGSGTLQYQWRRNGVDIAGANAASYTTPALALTDNGAQYSVVVSNTAGSATSSSALLTVNPLPVAPSIATAPEPQTVIVGQTASFVVSADGTGPLAYQWRRNGVDIAGANSPNYTTPVTTLADDGASFDVRVSNGAGNVISDAARLTVQAPVAANYWLRGDAGVPLAGTIAFADGAQAASAYNLTLVDPASLPATAVAEARGGWLLQASVGEARFNPQNAGDGSERFIVYARGTRLWRLDLLASSGTPTPVQVSSASLNELCSQASAGTPIVPLFQSAPDAGSSVLQYRKPGTDGTCGTADDSFVAIRVNAATGAAPVAVPRLLTALYDASGAITGYLARQGNDIQRLDASFGNATTIFTVGSGELNLLRTPGGPGLILFQDGTSLRAYDPAAGTGPVTIGTAAADFLQLGEVGSPVATAYYRNDGRIQAYRLDNSAPLTNVLTLAAGQTAVRGGSAAGRLFVVISGSGSSRLVALDAAGTVTNLIDEAGVIGSSSVGLTPTRLVYTIDGGRTLRSAPRAGGAALTLAAGPELRVFNQGSWTHENVWYDLTGSGGAIFGSQVRAVNADGSSPLTLDNTITVGGANFNGFGDTSVGRIVARPILADPLRSYAGATLVALDPVTRATRVSYGALADAGYNAIDVSRVGPDRPVLISASFVPPLAAATVDLYYIRVGTPGMVRLTSFVP